MKLTQIADHLNATIVPAIMGETFTIDPNLKNIIDLGTKIESMTADQFKDYLNKFVSGVARTLIDTRTYNPDNIPIRRDSQEYGGLIQSIKADTPDVSTSSLYTLSESVTYDKGLKYFGTEFDNKVYEKDVTWEIVRSIPRTMYKKSFTSAEGVSQLVALIENSVDRKLKILENALLHNLISYACINGVQVNLVTAYNSLIATIGTGEGAEWSTGETTTNGLFDKPVAVTASNALYNKHFVRWAKKTIANVLSNARYMNRKYNDGTVDTFLTDGELLPIFNEVAVNMIKYTLDDSFDDVFTDKIYTIPFWNSMSDDVIPSASDSFKILYNEGNDITSLATSTNRTLNNVIGLAVSKNAIGYTTSPIPVRTAYNEQGDFYNPFIDANCKYYIDTRDTMITFTLN